MSAPSAVPRIAVLGGGPTGLDAALAAAERGWDVTVYEAAPHVAGHVRAWGHVTLFTPWSMNLSPRLRAALPDLPCGDASPTGHEYADQLERAAALLGDRLRLGTRVDAVAREGLLKSEEIGSDRRARQPFRLLLTGPDGEERIEVADVVLDCTGTYGGPNPTGDGGIPARGERALADRIVRAIPDVLGDVERWTGSRVLLVGAGNSAQTVARDLAAAGARLVWGVRSPRPAWGAVPDDSLRDRVALVASSRRIAAGEVEGAEVVTGVVVESMRRAGEQVEVVLRDLDGGRRVIAVDLVLSMTGFVGDSELFRQLQVHQCYATEGPMALAGALLADGAADCLAQPALGVDALRNPEPRFFVLGIKSYGRNSTFLLRVGWEQVEEVFAALDAELRPAVSA
jgi:cation diffusion facilitator CzcD-associated flavoprotein CzcO